MREPIQVVGGGLAGCEAAWRLARHGLDVTLWEMKPHKHSPAHKLDTLAELVCSNSLRSDKPDSAVGLLKQELRQMGSVVMKAAELTKVPAGGALAVDREKFSQAVTDIIASERLITVKRAEVTGISAGHLPMVLASGPLTSGPLADELAKLVDAPNLYFYDALAPIVTGDSLDMSKLFLADRYGEEGCGDYLNAPMEKDAFFQFLDALKEADETPARDFEDKSFFEACLPIEVMAARGPRTLTFGPLKPVGFTDPATGRRPYAVVQLRRENLEGILWNLVGFQTRMTRPAQEKVFRLIPGLEKAVFARYGAIHRNTYLEAPLTLDEHQRLKKHPNIFVAGQLSGVEGYVESTAQGLWAGENAARASKGLNLLTPPRATALGSLLSHLSGYGGRKVFAPSNVNLGLFPAAPAEVPKAQKKQWQLETAHREMKQFLADIDYIF